MVPSFRVSTRPPCVMTHLTIFQVIQLVQCILIGINLKPFCQNWGKIKVKFILAKLLCNVQKMVSNFTFLFMIYTVK